MYFFTCFWCKNIIGKIYKGAYFQKEYNLALDTEQAIANDILVVKEGID